MEEVRAGQKPKKKAKKKKNTTSSSSTTNKEDKKAPGKTSEDAAACTGGTVETKDVTISLITWNVNGLDAAQQQERAAALCNYLIKYAADVVFLQEVTKAFALVLHKSLSADYEIIEGGKDGTFTMMLLKKSRITLERSGIVAFPATHMRRNLLVARVLFKGQKFSLMTSQLESGKANTAERKRQLRLVMLRINKTCDDVTVLFGGDTNLINSEVAEVGLPSGVYDVWDQLGKPQHCRYTWDTEANNNVVIPSICHYRFDRVYLRPATMERVPRLEPESMALLGLEKLECGRFTSHHWGVYCTFKIHK
ncbi:hypothetical protein Q5P01_005919 [Channa striata]|uniref:Tyrosyl-DNA phosphodiesterase 2 n=1 Tax=Channa striata TaxID=64152 RepID=A0AA88SZY5_CHASR|nr:hypothetical protein Q5P01_005919 [Channa striata]